MIDVTGWVDRLRAAVEASGQTWVAPNICDVNDEVCLEWWRGKRKITVYVCCTLYAEFIKVWGPNIDTEMEEGEVDEQNMPALWKWLNEDAT